MTRTGSSLPRIARLGPAAIALVIIASLVFATGCSRPKPIPVEIGKPAGPAPPSVGPAPPEPTEPIDPGQPPTSQGTKERPVIRNAHVGLCETYPNGGRVRGDVHPIPDSITTIGLDYSIMHLSLDPAPDETWVRSNVRAEGAVGSDAITYLVPHIGQMGVISVSFSTGNAGDIITVTLDSITLLEESQAQAIYTFQRLAEPRATLSAWIDDRWREISAHEVVSARPLRLRMEFTRPVDQTAVRSAVVAQCPGSTDLLWENDRTLIFDVPSPPPAIRIIIDDVRDHEGLWSLGGLPVVFTGEPPRLQVMSPAGAAGSPLCVVPPNIVSAVVSPGGDYLLVSYTAEATGWPGQYGGAKMVIEVNTGRAHTVNRPGSPVGWATADAFVLLEDQAWSIIDSGMRLLRHGPLPGEHSSYVSLSPDGTRLASVHLRHGEWDEVSFLYPADLAVTHLETGQTSWIRDFVWVYRPPTDWSSYVSPVWSADGKTVAGISDLPQERGIRVADVATGKVTTAFALPGEDCLTDRHFSWSPNGLWWLVGDELISSTGGAGGVFHLTGGPHGELWGRHLWSPDSRHVAYSVDWGLVVIVAVDGSGAVQVKDAHFGCGWSQGGELQFIVWPDHRYQFDRWWF